MIKFKRKGDPEVTESEIKNDENSFHTNNNSTRCNTEKALKKNRGKNVEMGFYSGEAKITEIEKEGNVTFKIKGTNLSGWQFKLNFDDQEDINLIYNGEKDPIKPGDYFFIVMHGDELDLSLKAEFKIK